MKKETLTKDQFINLPFDTKCVLLEMLMTDAYFSGQQEIGFWLPEDFTGENEEPLPIAPPEIKKIEDMKFAELLDKLTNELFKDKSHITVDEDLLNYDDLLFLYQ
ncbi:MAG: hypothetical protein GX677_01170 [Treponema sp.]|nr:hypothetical protein [Treponema sp.]